MRNLFLFLTLSIILVGCSSKNGSEIVSTDSIQQDNPTKDIVGKDFLELTSTTPKPVLNDSTSNWRIISISENVVLEEYVVSYYDTYFEGLGDNEIHTIVNFYNNTTTKLSDMGNFILVTVYDYVDGEEHDAKKLFSGTQLKQCWVYKEDGKIEDVE